MKAAETPCPRDPPVPPAAGSETAAQIAAIVVLRIIVGGAAFDRFVPSGPLDSFTALPILIYTWCQQPGPEFYRLAAAAIMVLLAVLVPMNAAAIAVRAWQQGKKV